MDPGPPDSRNTAKLAPGTARKRHLAGIPLSFLKLPQYSTINDNINKKIDVSNPSNKTAEPHWSLNITPAEEQPIYDNISDNVIEDNEFDIDTPTESMESYDNLSPKAKYKRVSAFKRLGPVSTPQPPNLTINLMYGQGQPVREVIGDGEANKEEQDVPVYKRKEILTSTDELIMKYLPLWPKDVLCIQPSKKIKDLTPQLKDMKSLEKSSHEKHWIKFVVTGYPPHFQKEDVLDILINAVKYYHFIPCFIEFNQSACIFLVTRCEGAVKHIILQIGTTLVSVEYTLRIRMYDLKLPLMPLDMIPRLVLRRRINLAYSDGNKMDLSGFCSYPPISHFIYYPLHIVANQKELNLIQTMVSCGNLVEINLSNNRLTTLKGFKLKEMAPKLKVLDVSNNYFEKLSELIDCRQLMLQSLNLEGNPLCADYFNQEEYIGVAKLLFPTLRKLDGVDLCGVSGLPPVKRNYCPNDATAVVERFLEIYFPLLDSSTGDRLLMAELYHTDATLSITYRKSLCNNPQYRYMREMFSWSRNFVTGTGSGCLEGAEAIARHLVQWPLMQHDPYTFHVDVMFHNENTTILRIEGVLKPTASSLADDEPLLFFCRTLVLNTTDGIKYLIHNELIHWDLPSEKYAEAAFKITRIKPAQVSLKMDVAPDDDLKNKLLDIFTKITKANQDISLRCLIQKKWDLRLAIEYFMKIVKVQP